ncbi:MAG: LuxR family transcriptional regulator [Myxococcales bacterium]|nr:MAG: LuxR family transcriptional regulator [Myxococcales bacterium]
MNATTTPKRVHSVRSVALLRVNPHGVIVNANHVAHLRWGNCQGRVCADLLRSEVCSSQCVSKLFKNNTAFLDREVSIHGYNARLICERIEDEVAVIAVLESSVRNALTPCETRVIRLVAQGLTNRQIATQLAISPSTVRTHIEHVRAKLGVHTRAAAIAKLATSGVELKDASAAIGTAEVMRS